MSTQPDDSALLHEYVQHALSKQGINTGAYKNFVKEFSALRKKAEQSGSELEVKMLTNLLHTLKNLVSLLRERTHDALMSEVLGIKLWNTAPEVRCAVLELVGNLVVVNSAFTHTCLQLLVYSFLPPPSPPQPDAGQGEWQPSQQELNIQASVLNALNKMLALVPTAPASLLSLVVQHMPHKLRDRNTQCLFLSAVFAVAEAPSGRPIRDSLLAAAVEHLLTLDVEIRWEDIVDVPTGQEEEEGESEQEDPEDIFELEGMSELDINGQPHSHALPHEQQQQQQQQGLQQLLSLPAPLLVLC
uniref:Uncharacterized protein n=1 Tax=Dunaliella tertiolecta TaxID=3047 RepID=A0A7S3QYM0_DUNTE